MKTHTDFALIDRELDAVVGGRINVPRSDFQDQRGVPGSTGGKGDVLFAGWVGFCGGLLVGVALAA